MPGGQLPGATGGRLTLLAARAQGSGLLQDTSNSAPEPSHALEFPQLDRSIVTQPGETVFQCARRNGVRIVGACGGRGNCGTCSVLLTHGKVRHSNGHVIAAQDAAARRRRPRWLRACRLVARSDCTIEVAERSLAPIVRANVEAGDSVEMLPLDAAVVSHDVSVPAATLSDMGADADRVARALPSPFATIDLAAARQLPAVLRDNNWSVRVRMRDGEAIDFAAPKARTLGLAVDLGTTNIAGFLVDLTSGARIASLGIENPQAAYGADVISRMNHAIGGAAAAQELRDAALTAINALAHDLCRAVEAATHDIVDIAICGNTAMHHLLLGLPVRQLGRAPFVAALREALDIKARDLGFSAAPGAYVHLAANIGGFVGGDHVAALLATEPQWNAATTSVVMDIGTNTEISLIHRGEIMTTSCPSGPALEGGHISCGMRAAEGAIERVSFGDGAIKVAVIGRHRPVGLCGSGVLDCIAALRAAGLLDERGRLSGPHPAIKEIEGLRAVVLAPGVQFNQNDVRAVQLAKAAIQTGVELLLAEARLGEGDIERVIIAGAFGAYIDIESAIAVGLLPDLPFDRFAQVGNAAGIGVRRMLASRQARAHARELAARCHYIELSTRSGFQKAFLNNIGFKTKPRARRAS
jgi:uncharacterized 2Fe-2S/4Fe-4S cluster protein (DUF4445 family)